MQAGKEPGEVYPKQSYHNDHHACNSPDAVDTGVLLAKHAAKMEICDIHEPGRQRPEFFGVPTPIIAPCEFAPNAAEDEPECQ